MNCCEGWMKWKKWVQNHKGDIDRGKMAKHWRGFIKTSATSMNDITYTHPWCKNARYNLNTF